MAKYYIYNRETLSYEVVNIPLIVRLRRGTLYALLGMAVSTMAVFLFSSFFDTPRAAFARRSIDDLQIKYTLLMQEFRQTDNELTELMHRDNSVYRSVFEADIIPLSVREAGMGGQ